MRLRLLFGKLLIGSAVLIGLAGCATYDHLSDGAGEEGPTTRVERAVAVGYYAFFDPVSYSSAPSADVSSDHRGYEADLLDAVESMDGIGLRFERSAIKTWDGIWLEPAHGRYDMVGGGITILESRAVDASGDKVIAFTDGHIAFSQSLLVRAEDAERLSDHASLLSDDTVGALPNTTGEARLLAILGVVDDQGYLATGTRIEVPGSAVIADSGAGLRIDASGASPELRQRTRLIPADPRLPQVLYLGDEQGDPLGEAALLEALRDGRIDAFARGNIGNAAAAAASNGEFALTALDDLVERGGFAVDVDDEDLLGRLNDAVAWLTDQGRIGFGDWLSDPGVFMARAAEWSPG